MAPRAKGLTFHPLTPRRWRDFETLFGLNGACAGCWCIFWRLGPEERFRDVKGPKAKKRMKQLVDKGAAKGLLAYAGKQPVGWLTFGPRRSFSKLDRAPSLKCDDAERVGALPCFFIHKDWRGRGVATQLVQHALPLLKKEGVEVAEAYPLRPPRKGERLPAAFAYTGTVEMFQKHGFEPADSRPKGKLRMRKEL